MDPLADLNVHLPGRIMALESLVAHVLAIMPEQLREEIFASAHRGVSASEADVHAQKIGQTGDYALKVFEAARQSLDDLRTKTTPRR